MVSLVKDQVESEDTGQDQQVVLARGDINRVARGQAESAFGDAGSGLTTTLNGEFVTEQVAGDLHVTSTGNIDGEPFAERREQVLAHLGDVLAVDGDFVGR